LIGAATGRTTSCAAGAGTSSSSAKKLRPVTVGMSSIKPAARSSRATSAVPPCWNISAAV
jgi:hypothetical protein